MRMVVVAPRRQERWWYAEQRSGPRRRDRLGRAIAVVVIVVSLGYIAAWFALGPDAVLAGAAGWADGGVAGHAASASER